MAETFRKALVEVLVPEIRELREETRAGLAELRKETSAGFAAVREEIRAGLADVRKEIQELREESRAGLADVRKEIQELREESRAGLADVRKEISGLKGSVDELGRGQDRILARLDVLDVGQRMARLETLFEQHLKSSPPAA